MFRQFRQSAPVIAAFAIIAMVLHAWFWVACATAGTYAATGTQPTAGSGGLTYVLCTPLGARVLEQAPGQAPGTAGGEDPAPAQDCPTCMAMAASFVPVDGVPAIYPVEPPRAPVRAILALDAPPRPDLRRHDPPRAPPLA